MIVVPENFQRSTVDREHERGAAWIADLPGVVADLLERWGCTQDGRVMHGGVGIIVPVLRIGDQGPAVLKISFPHPGNVAEPDAFAAWDGRGAVRLYARDDEHFAMLLERAHPTTLAAVRDNEEVIRIAGRLNRRLAVPAPPGLPRLSDQAEEWEQSLLRDTAELSHALPSVVVDAAVATVRELGREQPEVMIHGDLHPGNILRADREPWLAVDPKGYAGDPAYDGGTLLKSRVFAFLEEDEPDKAMVRGLDIFADAAEVDPERVRRWAQYHAVAAAFWARRHGFHGVRGGAELDRFTQLADHAAQVLTPPH